MVLPAQRYLSRHPAGCSQAAWQILSGSTSPWAPPEHHVRHVGRALGSHEVVILAVASSKGCGFALAVQGAAAVSGRERRRSHQRHAKQLDTAHDCCLSRAKRMPWAGSNSLWASSLQDFPAGASLSSHCQPTSRALLRRMRLHNGMRLMDAHKWINGARLGSWATGSCPVPQQHRAPLAPLKRAHARAPKQTARQGMWARHVGKARGQGTWARHVGKACGSALLRSPAGASWLPGCHALA